MTNHNINSNCHEAWNKITQTHDLFKKIIAPLKQHLNINFGYMIVFKDGSYYQIIEDLECLKKWVTNVETSHIFCARNVTTYFDDPYNFTIWPEEPTCTAMEIYKEHDMWNGITVSKHNKDYTELYWFTKQNAEDGWHKWFIRNKQSLLKFVNYFSFYKKELFISEGSHYQVMFKFVKRFGTDMVKSIYVNEESNFIKTFVSSLIMDSSDIHKKELKFTRREQEILAIVCRGYTAKIVAQELKISLRTVHYHLEKIKLKTGLHFKNDLIKFYVVIWDRVNTLAFRRIL